MTFSVNPSDKILIIASVFEDIAVACGGFAGKYKTQVDFLCCNSENVQVNICEYDIILIPYENNTQCSEFLKLLLEKQGYKPNVRILRYELQIPIKDADYYEDISDYINEKKELIMRCKKSGGVALAENYIANNKFRTFTSYLSGSATYVEAFLTDDINAYMQKPDVINSETDKDFKDEKIETFLANSNAQQKINDLAEQYADKKIAVYGADNFSRSLFKNYDLSGLNIIAIADKRFEQDRKHDFYGIKCIKPEELANCGADLLLIADLDFVKTYDILTNTVLKDSNIEIAPFIKTELNVKDRICTRPFHILSIVPTGHCITCCPAYINNYAIGNVLHNNFSDIWNGKRAKFLRNSLIKNDYTICDLKTCIHMELNDREVLADYYESDSDNVKFPDTIYMGWDFDCNVACITCRNQIIKNDAETLEKMKTIEERVLEACKSAKYFYTSGNGDPFGSSHARSIIKKIVEINPDIKFLIHSNGILCNKKMCDELNITNKIKNVTFSIHAAHKETYDKIVRYGNFDRVLENLEWLSSMKKDGKIEDITMVFVVHKINYKDMPDFVKLAEKFNAVASFRYYRQWANNTEYSYEDMAVFDKSHPEHAAFVELLQDKIFNSSHCTLDPSLKSVRDEFVQM